MLFSVNLVPFMRCLATTLLLLLLATTAAQAQVTTSLTGTAYLDYVYHADSPNDDLRNSDGFTYRRIYLGANARMSETVDARIRFSADRSTIDGPGARPYVKDAFVRWRYAGRHSARLGVTAPPVFDFSEDVWRYRSLEQTLLDLAGIADSRDFGLRLDGPLWASGEFTYSLMYASNNYARPEINAGKRVYGRIAYSSGLFHGAVASNYGALGSDGPDAWTTNILISVTGNRGRLGGEAYVMRADELDAENYLGGSVFLLARLGAAWEAVARADRLQSPYGDATLLLGGVSYAVTAGFRLMPNVLFLSNEGGNHDTALLRLTAEINF